MAISLRVIHGTRSGSEKSLCYTCWSGVCTRGESESQDRIHCNAMGRAVKGKITSCTSYSDRTMTPIHEMYKIAWILETSKNQRTIGFVPYREWREKHRDEDPVGNVPQSY